MILFGGHFGPPLNDTWHWDGTEWFEDHPGTPPQRDENLIYDARRGRILMFGGIGADYGPVHDMWEWNGAS